MTQIYDLQQRANVLRKKTATDSISPEEVGGLHADTLAYIANMERYASSLGIKKVYTSVSEMNGDESPVSSTGMPLKAGQLVTIFNAEAPDAENSGEIYAFQNPGWLLAGRLDSGNYSRLSNIVRGEAASISDNIRSPYTFIGNFATWAEVQTELDKLHNSDGGADNKVIGEFRVQLDGRNLLVRNWVQNWATGVFTQTVEGSVSWNGETMEQSLQIATYERTHNESSGWGEWEISSKETQKLRDIESRLADEVVDITGFGIDGASANISKVGDIYYNTDTKKLRICVNYPRDFEDYPYDDFTTYKNLSDGKYYYWDGENLVETDSKHIGLLFSGEMPLLSTTVDITGFGIDGASANISKVGDIYYNTDTKKLRICVNYPRDFEDYPYGYITTYKNLSDGKYYYWNGENLVETSESSNYPMNITELVNFACKRLYETIKNTDIYNYSPALLTHENLNATTHKQLYSEYDALCEKYPLYLKRADDGSMLDENGNEIRLYKLRFNDTFISTSESGGGSDQWKDEYEYNRCLLTSGVHGDEKTSVWGLLYTIRDILSSKTVECSFIRNNCTLYIMPCINPWGFDNNSRNNKNGLNVNRDAGTFTTREAQAYKQIIDSTSFALCIDVHGTQGSNAYFEFPKNFTPQSELFAIAGKYYSSKKYELSNIYGDASYKRRFFSLVSTFDGTFSEYAVSTQGAFSLITETPRDIKGTLVNYDDACAITQSMLMYILYFFYSHMNYIRTFNDEDVDWALSDANKNILVSFSNGHIQTKNFNSANILIPKNLKGKRLSILGDSISTFGVPDQSNATGTWTYPGNRCRYPQSNLLTNVDDMYWKRIIDKYDMVLGINESWAGSRVSNSQVSDSGDLGPNRCMSSVKRISHLGENGTPDIILVYGGTNDAGANVTIGEFNTENPKNYSKEEIDGLSVETFADAYRAMLIRLMYYYPTSRIIVVLPNFTTSYYTITNLDLYVEVIKEACDFFGIDYVDIRRAGITIYNEKTYLPDGIHPNANGHKLISEMIAGKFDNLNNN